MNSHLSEQYNFMKLYYMTNKENVIRLYKKYKSSGGFGAYPVDMLIGDKSNNINEKLQQEKLLIELHNITYDKPITEFILKHNYLGRERVNAYSRVNNNLSKCRIPREYINRNIDPYTVFMRTNSIRNYMNRAYWNEREKMKKELQ